MRYEASLKTRLMLFHGKNKMRMIRQRAFTMLEIIIIVAILGVISAIAVPKMLLPRDYVKSNEARSILLEMLESQRRYFLLNNTYLNHLTMGGQASAMARSDISVPAPRYHGPAYFQDAVNYKASIQDLENKYWLAIDITGRIFCVNLIAGSCASIKCNKAPGGNTCN